MKLATETITIFHNAFNPATAYDAWTPTVIRGVSFHGDTATNVTDTGLIAASRYTIRIPEDADTGGKAYVEPPALSDPETQWTIAAGDVIVKGEAERIPEDGKITVVGVTDNRRGRARHWKVVGK